MANVTEASSFSSLGSDYEPVTVKHFRCINHQVGGKWKDVLRNLSMEEVSIENVDAENSKVSEKFYQGLLEWMRSRGTQRATTRELCEALYLAGCKEALEKLLREGMSNNSEHIKLKLPGNNIQSKFVASDSEVCDLYSWNFFIFLCLVHVIWLRSNLLDWLIFRGNFIESKDNRLYNYN